MKSSLKLSAIPVLVLILSLGGCSADAMHFEDEVATCMSQGGSHLECEQKAKDVECVRAGSRYGEHADDEVIRYRCSDGTYYEKS
jgi:hypothetical protein